ncbi:MULTISPECIES: CorA family divalent cation transporter [Lacrimispora]|uniref:magnesium transporter CorA family protein n=1 Tax=Lacrimispora TaxID=2719231 RepID=UPI000690AA1D|nr:CorA family divalent cation transporter [Lacrimispora celerecrescens]MBW4846359.1 magnesium and cobalt transporter CorA [Lachnospiraceae bacterium]
MRYRIKKRLVPVGADEVVPEGEALVEIMSKEEYWKAYHTKYQDHLLMKNLERAQYCRADLLKDCVIGTLVIPVKKELLGRPMVFGYYMDQSRLIFLDDSGEVGKILKEMERNQIFDKTCVSHILFEFLEYQVKDEIEFLQKYEEKLAAMEDRIMSGKRERSDVPGAILRARKELAKISSYYGQLLNVSQTLMENYNGLLKDEECVLFHLFSGRMARLTEHGKELREYALQIREMYQVHIDMKQNHVLSFLTMVTVIFMPLTLIAGWYGMNFKNMPELNWNYGYQVCVAASVIIILIEIWYFNKNGWLKR